MALTVLTCPGLQRNRDSVLKRIEPDRGEQKGDRAQELSLKCFGSRSRLWTGSPYRYMSVFIQAQGRWSITAPGYFSKRANVPPVTRRSAFSWDLN